MHLNADDAKFLGAICGEFRNDFNSNFLRHIRDQMPYFDADTPEPIREFSARINTLCASFNTNWDSEIDDSSLPTLKLIVQKMRLRKASEIEVLKARTNDPGMLAMLEKQLGPYDEIIHRSDFRDANPATMPRLNQYLTLEIVEKIQQTKKPRRREYDEKFHILQAPSLFYVDLAYYRESSNMRRMSICIAYIDIDDFKTFNTKYGNTIIDRALLPIFMETMEAHVFGLGYAYRFGGDEYVFILASTNEKHARSLLEDFQEKLRTLSFRGIEEKVTVSIGFCLADADCSLTNSELLQKVDAASKFAKVKGKNRLATYRGHLFDDSDLIIVGEPQSEG